ncbi:hypothetical protein FACS189430_10280 [Bacteroidia bacterium]|nr:hypothetical protein FACS189430_10280 [Bacteroidia bacterium]
MTAKIVLDISSIVWDENDFNTNQSSYYTLKSEVSLFIQAFEKCSNLIFVAREELLNEIQSLFPYKILNEHKMFDFQRLVLQFLSAKRNVSYTAISSNIISSPNICCTYFSGNLKEEIGYLITEMHNSFDKHIFCTFSTLWQNNGNLKTNNGNQKEHYTVIHGNTNSTIENYYLQNIRNIFEHNPKHDSNKGVYYLGNEKVNPLSCYNERSGDTAIPQSLLDIAIPCNDEFYSFDTKNKTFVCFKNTTDNIYHGYDEDINDVPPKIREEFHK